MITLYQKTLQPRTFWGIDTIQGLLELAEGFDGNDDHLRLCEPEEVINAPNSFYSRVQDLTKEGYVSSTWAPQKGSDGKTLHHLERIALTTQGHLLLDDIRKRSAPTLLRFRLVELAWVIITSILTSFITVTLMGRE